MEFALLLPFSSHDLGWVCLVAAVLLSIVLALRLLVARPWRSAPSSPVAPLAAERAQPAAERARASV
jgi:hypothetical protein